MEDTHLSRSAALAIHSLQGCHRPSQFSAPIAGTIILLPYSDSHEDFPSLVALGVGLAAGPLLVGAETRRDTGHYPIGCSGQTQGRR